MPLQSWLISQLAKCKENRGDKVAPFFLGENLMDITQLLDELDKQKAYMGTTSMASGLSFPNEYHPPKPKKKTVDEHGKLHEEGNLQEAFAPSRHNMMEFGSSGSGTTKLNDEEARLLREIHAMLTELTNKDHHITFQKPDLPWLK